MQTSTTNTNVDATDHALADTNANSNVNVVAHAYTNALIFIGFCNIFYILA